MSISAKIFRAGVALVWTSGLLVRSPYPGLAAPVDSLLPAPGQVLGRGPVFRPAGLRGLRVYPANPFELDFIVQPGEDDPNGISLDQAQTLMKYFLATLTTPADDIWVNLSPAEPDKIIPEGLGQTRMGRDLLAQDYILKQLTASLLHPDGAEGRAFWARVQDQVAQSTGGTDIPVDLFNRVWIVPDQAEVYENAGAVYIVQSRLKVMLEQDYWAGPGQVPSAAAGDAAAEQALREVVLPALTEEVNTGAHFAPLRQIYQAMILATWYKTRLRDSLLNQVYSDQGKTAGIALDDPAAARQEIYTRYLAALDQGAFAFVREDADPQTNQPLPRKYFSGGFDGLGAGLAELIRSSPLGEAASTPDQQLFHVELQAARPAGSSPVSRARLDKQGPEAGLYLAQVRDSQEPQVVREALARLFDRLAKGADGLAELLQEVVVQRRTQTVIGDGRILVALDQALDRLGVERDQVLAQGYVQALANPDLPVRQNAAAALSRPRYRTSAAYPALLARFQDQQESLFVKRLSVRALLNQLDPSDGHVRRLTALMDQKTQPADPDFASADLRAEIVRALSELGQTPLAAEKDAALAQWREQYGPELIRRLPFLKEGQITDARILAAVQQDLPASSPVGPESSVVVADQSMTFQEAKIYHEIVTELRGVADGIVRDIHDANLSAVFEALASWRQSIPEEAMSATLENPYTSNWNRPEVNQRLRTLRDILDSPGQRSSLNLLSDRLHSRYRGLMSQFAPERFKKYRVVFDDLFGVVLDFLSVVKISDVSFQTYLDSTVPIAEVRAEVVSWARWVDDISRRFKQYQWLLSDHLYRPELIVEGQTLLSATAESAQAAPIYRDLLVPYRKAVSMAKEISSSPIAEKDWPRAGQTLKVLQKYAGEIREQMEADGFLAAVDRLRDWVTENDPVIVAAIPQENSLARAKDLIAILNQIKQQSKGLVGYLNDVYPQEIQAEQGLFFYPVLGLPDPTPIAYDLRHCPLGSLQVFYAAAGNVEHLVAGFAAGRFTVSDLRAELADRYEDMTQRLKIFDQYLTLINEHIPNPQGIDPEEVASYQEGDGSPVHIYPAFLLPYYEALTLRQDESAVAEAVSSPAAVEDRVGGIALNPNRLGLRVRRGPDGLPLPAAQQPLGDLRVDGLIPVIINVTPVTNLPLLLGAQAVPSDPFDRLSRRLP